MPITHRRLVQHRTATLAVALVALVALGCGGLGARPTVDTQPVNPIRPRMTATPGPQHVAMDAFAELVTAEDFSYRVSFKGGVGLSTANFPIEGRMDVAGPDFASAFTYDLSGEIAGLDKPLRLSVRLVDGQGYARFQSGAWTEVDLVEARQMTTAFAGVTSVRDIRYIGAEERDSGTFYRISVPKAVLIHPFTIPGNPTSEKVRRTTLEVLIDSAGQPVIGTWTSENQARVGGQLQGVDYELRLTFSKLGDDIDVSAP